MKFNNTGITTTQETILVQFNDNKSLETSIILFCRETSSQIRSTYESFVSLQTH